jgi:integrase
MTEIILRQDTPISAIERLLESDPRLISIHTTRQYKSNLLDFEEYRAGRPITKTLVEAYAAHLQGGDYSPRTINQRLASIRWYARKLADLAQDYATDADPETIGKLSRAALVEDVKGDSPERGRHIDTGELYALLQACLTDTKNPAAGARDAALFAIAWSTGLRRDEISRIQMDDLKETEEGYDLRLQGKGNKHRTAYINNGALSALRDWIHFRGTDPGRLFVNVRKNGKIAGGKLSGEAMRKLLYKRGLLAGLAEPVTWHDFRRTFAGNLWDANIDGATIQKLMGHASQNQTARYDRRPESKRRDAVKVLQVPYKRIPR